MTLKRPEITTFQNTEDLIDLLEKYLIAETRKYETLKDRQTELLNRHRMTNKRLLDADGSGRIRPISVLENDMAETRNKQIADLVAERDSLKTQLAEVVKEKNGAYTERNRGVAALAFMLKAQGYTVIRSIHPASDKQWQDDWRQMVVIYGPTGQMTWHFHDPDAYLLDGLPTDSHNWDGHTTPEKYERLAALNPPSSNESSFKGN